MRCQALARKAIKKARKIGILSQIFLVSGAVQAVVNALKAPGLGMAGGVDKSQCSMRISRDGSRHDVTRKRADNSDKQY